jgi:Lipid A 3-O-deacylase (PagL)
MNLRNILIALLLMLCALGLADNRDPRLKILVAPSYYFNIFGGQSLTILGSEDKRTAIGFGVGYGKPEPRFAMPRVGAQLVWEGYYDHSGSPGIRNDRPNQAESLGVLAYGRWRWPQKRGLGAYATLGWGIQYANQTSRDLDSKINSTPMIGFGVSWNTGQGEGSLGIRLLHISNAGLVGENQGQNQLFLVYGWRF